MKGIEFDKVFVVANKMTKTEKYIAYTRALSELIVVVDEEIVEQEPVEKMEEGQLMKDCNMQRFIEAHRKTFDVALGEIRAGYKVSHRIWYIFLQIKGFGRSEIAEYYAIIWMRQKHIWQIQYLQSICRKFTKQC